MKRIIYTAAAAAAVLTGSVVAAAPAFASQAPSYSAYYWQPNGNALGGPQAMPGGTTQFSATQGLAKITEKVNNADLREHTIQITWTLSPDAVGSLRDPAGEGDDPNQANPYVRVYFAGGSAGTNANSTDGYMSQSWWANGTGSWQYLNNQLTYTVTVKVDPAAGWGNWNGQQAIDNPDLFNAAASHVREVGLSFGGGYFFENGVTGTGSITTNINVSG